MANVSRCSTGIFDLKRPILFTNQNLLTMERKLRFILMLVIPLLTMAFAQAQQRTYSGVVRDTEGKPIVGASIVVVGTAVGTSSSESGQYSIQANQGSRISYSLVGKESTTITTTSNTTINVTLNDANQEIEDIVVIAYGTAKKKDLTGAISTVDSKVLGAQANSTLTKALEGAVPGIQVSSVDGQPGVDMGVRVRGIGSSSQNNSNALIVIDGVPVTAGFNPLSTMNPKDIESVTILKDAASTALWGSRGANGVIMVTSKKGARGGTKIDFDTKLGANMIANNQPKLIRSVEDNYEMMWESIYNSVRYGSTEKYKTNFSNPNMSHEEAALFASQHLFNYTGSTSTFAGPNGLSNWMYYRVPGARYVSTGTGDTRSATMLDNYLIDPATGKINKDAVKLYDVDDWRDIAYRDRFRQEYTVSASGGTEKTDYFISTGFLSDPSYIANSNFKRYNVRSNVNSQITDWLKAGLNATYSNRSTRLQNGRFSSRNPGAAVQNVFRWTDGYRPLASIYERDENGNMVYDANGNPQVVRLVGQQYSPLGVVTPKAGGSTSMGYDLEYQMENSQSEYVSNDISTIGYLQAKFWNDFTFNVQMAVNQSYHMRYVSLPKAWGESSNAEQGMIGRYHTQYLDLNSQQTLNWGHDYGKHHVDAMIGHEFTWMKTENMNYKASLSLIDNFTGSGNYLFLNNGGTFSGVGFGTNKEAMEGYFARANYIYDNKYIATGSVRRDGSSKFRYNEDRWGIFWSLGGAWRISSEPFMEPTNGWLNDLKLRASYGVIGNQNGIGRYAGYQTWNYGALGYTTPGSYAPSGYTLTMGAAVNSSLTWEKKNTIDAGLDISLFNRVNATIDWYKTNTTDLLLDVPVSYAMAGQSTLLQNEGELESKGLEVDVNVDLMKSDDFNWSVNVNTGHYKVKVVRMPETMINQQDALHDHKWWYATADAWGAVGNTGSGSGAAYRRWIGGDYYNVIFAKYMGVDKGTGLPLYGALVTEGNQGKFPDAKVGDVISTTDYSEAYMFDYGDATPDLIGGFGTSVRWKSFDLAANFAYQLGGLFLSNLYGNFIYNTSDIGNQMLSEDLLNNTFNESNQDAKYPMLMVYSPNASTVYSNGTRVSSGNTYTDLSVFDASYLNIKNITVGYTLPEKWSSKAKMSSVRAYVSLDNMWVFAKSGIDPRNSIVGGLDVGAYTYPMIRSSSFGLKVTF